MIGIDWRDVDHSRPPSFIIKIHSCARLSDCDRWKVHYASAKGWQLRCVMAARAASTCAVPNAHYHSTFGRFQLVDSFGCGDLSALFLFLFFWFAPMLFLPCAVTVLFRRLTRAPRPLTPVQGMPNHLPISNWPLRNNSKNFAPLTSPDTTPARIGFQCRLHHSSLWLAAMHKMQVLGAKRFPSYSLLYCDARHCNNT